MSAIDAVDGFSPGTRVPWMWVRLYFSKVVQCMSLLMVQSGHGHGLKNFRGERARWPFLTASSNRSKSTSRIALSVSAGILTVRIVIPPKITDAPLPGCDCVPLIAAMGPETGVFSTK